MMRHSWVQIEHKKNKIEVEQLSNELAISKKCKAIQGTVDRADKTEWYPNYSKAGKFGAFIVDFVFPITAVLNLLSWVFSGFGFLKENHTIMHAKSVKDYEKELLCEMNKEPEIYDVIKRKNSTEDIGKGLHTKKQNSKIIDKYEKNDATIVEALINNSDVLGNAENDKDKMDEIVETHANTDLPSNAATPEPNANDDDNESVESYTIN
ncbi:MAG: hypothetical protein GY821_03640 [Gammaproteobacteria bacterium]|nr:hypothetical protein [Gammaproteobacteria bacterium]